MRINDYEMNRLQLFKAIRRSEPVARTDLVKMTGLAGGTVSQLTADFLKRDLVLEEKSANPAFGRPRIGLRINAKGGHVLSVSPLADERASIEIVDLRGDPVFTRVAPIKRVKTLKAWSRQIAAIIDESIESSPLSRQDIFRIGVLVQGVVDNSRGVVHWLATFPDEDVPVGAILEQQLKIPVMIDNDANVIARAEHWFGEVHQSDDFSMILVDLGLNNAHYTDGMLWSGAHGINPEFGHSKIVWEDGRRCYCGAHGCLVAYSSIWGIVSKVFESKGVDTPIQTKMHAAFRDIAQAARTGNAQAREAFSIAGRMLGIAAANMLNERDPGRIVIAAFAPDLAPMISDSFFSALELNTLPALRGRVTVEFKLIDVDYYRKGAAAMALEHIYRSPDVQRTRAGRRRKYLTRRKAIAYR